MSAAANALFGILVLILGRRLFWLFVAVAGVVVGFNLAEQVVSIEAAWLLLAIGVVGGIIGALLAVFAQRLAVAVEGGGYLRGTFLGPGQLEEGTGTVQLWAMAASAEGRVSRPPELEPGIVAALSPGRFA